MQSEKRTKLLQRFVSKLNLNVKNFNLLNVALTHSSFIRNSSSLCNNERLEFFGDAVLKMYISEYLMSKYSDYNEGELSNLRAYVVSDKVLTKVSKKLDLHKYLLTSVDIKNKLPDSVTANSLEALLAVIYYECGAEIVKKFILTYWKEFIELANKDKGKENYKAVLQEYTQANKLGLPEYKIVREEGPDHIKTFEAAVYLNNKEIARGYGKNKKEASQIAAYNALNLIQSFRKV